MQPWAIVVLSIVGAIVLLILVSSIKIVRQTDKYVIERLGGYLTTWGVGIHMLIPFFDRISQRVTMKEQVKDFDPQPVITKDNVVVTVDAIIYYEATDPVKLTYNVADFYGAATKLAQTNLRNVIGETELDEALTSRDIINAKLRAVLDDATDKWGVRIVRVEIKRIDPPVDVTQAMHRQMKAEREKRAQVLEAEGFRNAQILRAEGAKQSAILQAEGQREAAYREAEARERLAEAEAKATRMVSEAIAAGDINAINYFVAQKYVEALKEMAHSPNQKVFIMPMEATAILGSLGGIAELSKSVFGENRPGAGHSPTGPRRGE